MPYTRTWSEELVAKWLQLEGYFVATAVPTYAGQRGGRSEADVVGARVGGDILEIKHIEVGSLGDNPSKSISKVNAKFSKANLTAIENYCKEIIGFPASGSTKYERLYVATWVSDKTLQAANTQKVPIISLNQFIKDMVIPTIKKWKDNPPHKTKTKGLITLPDGLWLLHLIDKMTKIQ